MPKPATDVKAGGAFTGGWQTIDGAESPVYSADSDTFNHDSDDDDADRHSRPMR